MSQPEANVWQFVNTNVPVAYDVWNHLQIAIHAPQVLYAAPELLTTEDDGETYIFASDPFPGGRIASDTDAAEPRVPGDAETVTLVDVYNAMKDDLSLIGLDDLQYTGNRFVQPWEGCPPEACRHLGVSYGEG